MTSKLSASSRSRLPRSCRTISSNSVRAGSSRNTGLKTHARSGVEQHEEKAAEHHAIEHEGQEADAADQIHQKRDGENPGDEGEYRGVDRIHGYPLAARKRIADGEDDRSGGCRDGKQEREARRVGTGEA